MSLSELQSAAEAHSAGRWDEALSHYESALQRAARSGDPALTADVLRRVGTVHTERGDLEVAAEIFEASLAIADACGFRDRVAFAEICLATVEQRSGRLGAAEAGYLRAREIALSLGDERIAAMVDQNIGAIANIRGDVETALVHYRTALQCYERLRDQENAARTLHNMGMAHLDLGEWEEAAHCLDRAMEVAVLMHDPGTVANVELARAELDLARARFDGARDHCDRAFEVFGRLGSESGLAEVYKLYGILYRETGKPEPRGRRTSRRRWTSRAAASDRLSRRRR